MSKGYMDSSVALEADVKAEALPIKGRPSDELRFIDW